jgi:DNA-directed RNA polymerase subunit N (RpoN/RPB10)
MSAFINPKKQRFIAIPSVRGKNCPHSPEHLRIIGIERSVRKTKDILRPYVHIDTIRCTKCGTIIEEYWTSAYSNYQDGRDAIDDFSLGGKWLLKYKQYKAALQQAGLI